MKSFFSIATLAAFLFAFGSATAVPNSASFSETAEFVAEKERDARVGESLLSPIRTSAELSAYLQLHKTSPFNALSKRSQQLFVESLVFTENGLASYRYRELESELTPRQAFELLSLFGAQKTLGYLQFAQASSEESNAAAKLAPVLLDDHKGYRCVPPATCQSSMDHICIGANCGMYPW